MLDANLERMLRMAWQDPALAQRYERGLDAAHSERGLQPLSMPARVVGGDGDVRARVHRQPNDCSSRAGSSAPVRQVLPLANAVTCTDAGANRCGSIL